MCRPPLLTLQEILHLMVRKLCLLPCHQHPWLARFTIVTSAALNATHDNKASTLHPKGFRLLQLQGQTPQTWPQGFKIKLLTSTSTVDTTPLHQQLVTPQSMHSPTTARDFQAGLLHGFNNCLQKIPVLTMDTKPSDCEISRQHTPSIHARKRT